LELLVNALAIERVEMHVIDHRITIAFGFKKYVNKDLCNMATFAKLLQEIIYEGKNVQKEIPLPNQQKQ